VRRHEPDLVALVAGLLFLGISAAYLVGELTDLRLDPRWVGPLALLAAGTAGLLASLSRLGREAGARGRPRNRGRRP
jgi:hypothetical protein